MGEIEDDAEIIYRTRAYDSKAGVVRNSAQRRNWKRLLNGEGGRNDTFSRSIRRRAGTESCGRGPRCCADLCAGGREEGYSVNAAAA